MAAQSAGTHPEAELLNAFAENALAANERESVLGHLSMCANCREIVSLAVQTRPEGAPLAKPARGGFRWATLQWASVAASVAIVTVAVLVVGPKKINQTESGQAALKREPAAAPNAPPPGPATNTVADNRVSTLKPDANANAKLPEGKKTAGIGSVTGAGLGRSSGGIVGGISQPRQDEKGAAADALAKSPEKKEAPAVATTKPAPSREYAYSTNASQDADTFVGGRTAPSLNQPAQGTLSAGKQNAPSVPPPASVADGERARAQEQAKTSNDVKKDKQAEAAVEASSESVQLSSQATTANARNVTSQYKITTKSAAGGAAVATRLDTGALRVWRQSSGKIQSSDDGGKSWQARNAATGFQATVVATAGGEVWAGGKAGALYVSGDNGQTWKKVSLTGDDIIPLGDVAEIRIANGGLADVVLNSGDDWQSNDGGKSFRLLPRKP